MAETIQRLPGATEKWQHHSGKIYTVVCVCNTASSDPEKFPITVVYEDQFGNAWSRPAHIFVKKFTRVPRKAR